MDRVFNEEGISGSLFERPSMQALIKYIDQNPSKQFVLIFDDLKRFARDVQVHLGLKKEFKSRDVQVLSPNFHFQDSPEGELVETIVAAQAEYERKSNQRQVCQKMKARLEQGYWTFYVPVGFKYEKSQNGGKVLALDEPKVSIIKEGFEKMAHG